MSQTGQEEPEAYYRGLCVVDASGQLLFANAALGRMLGIEPPAAAIGRRIDEFLAAGDAAYLALAREQPRPTALSLVAADGQRELPVFISWQTLDANANAEAEAGVGAVLLISPRSLADGGSDPDSARLEMALEAGRLGAWSLDLSTGQGWRTRLHDAIFGYRQTLPRWSYERFMSHVAAVDVPAVREAIAQARRAGTDWEFECRIQRVDGAERWIAARGAAERDVHGEQVALFGVLQDITERKTAEARIEFLAYYDPLTELPNRRLLDDRLEQAIRAARRSGRLGVLLFIDLDDFKVLNDTLGHTVGDQLLQAVALRLRGCVHADDTVARFGGDEFVVLMSDMAGDENGLVNAGRHAADKIIARITQPYDCDMLRHRPIGCSIGAVSFGGDERTVGELLRQGDLAMYRAKEAGGNRMRFYAAHMQRTIDSRVSIERDIRKGIAHEFALYFQPQIDFAGEQVKAEALLRWPGAEGGMRMPAEFIPIAEASGLIVPLGRFVLDSACRQLKAWQADPKLARIAVSINISARQFQESAFENDVLDALERHGVDGEKLVLELTESILVDDIEQAIARIARLRARGLRFSLDDFGTGYCSLYYLKRLPLDELKIDRRFVLDALSEGNDDAIVHTIIALGQCMGLTVVAEGVETDTLRDLLIGHGCHIQQGYLYSRPLPPLRFEAFMREAHDDLRARHRAAVSASP